jgi:hypothetical protein
VRQSEYRGSADHDADHGAADAFDAGTSAKFALQRVDIQGASAHFPKFAHRRRDTISRTSESHGRWNPIILVPLSI